MKLRFRETMSGWVNGPEGPRLFSFSVRALGPKARAIAGWAPMVLQGTVSLEDIAEASPLLSGSFLWVGVPFHRQLRYHLSFKDRDAKLWRFYGTKTVRLLNPLQSMTHLKGELFRDGQEYGPAELRFAVHDLPAFLRSFHLETKPSER